ncbi:hypothetical protein NA57DRAFT_62040 [Rhizodiscina lignyota]|uniref:Uncharacterized protein n=1 Tax=Rhizodiscina lignyota TaxID=1504668 RepID=A0A9P4M0X3_9PEZI|nr:hypothetical protein NA57DRAFT_62040 [Rhizodiscina lignyota]
MATAGPSTDSDTRHLLAPSQPASIMGTSRPPSIMTQDDNIPVKDSGITSSEDAIKAARQRAQSVPELDRPYRGFPSRDEYYEALAEFAKEKQFFTAEQQLNGFYGTKTMQEYLNEKGGSKTMSRKEKKAQKERRRSEQPRLAGVPETEGDAEGQQEGPGELKEQTRRPSWAMFGRRSRART